MAFSGLGVWREKIFDFSCFGASEVQLVQGAPSTYAESTLRSAIEVFSSNKIYLPCTVSFAYKSGPLEVLADKLHANTLDYIKHTIGKKSYCCHPIANGYSDIMQRAASPPDSGPLADTSQSMNGTRQSMVQ